MIVTAKTRTNKKYHEIDGIEVSKKEYDYILSYITKNKLKSISKKQIKEIINKL